MPTSRPVWKIKTRQRGLLKASCTAAKRLGAKYALLQRAPIACRSSGSLSPEPATGMASASCVAKPEACLAVVGLCVRLLLTHRYYVDQPRHEVQDAVVVGQGQAVGELRRVAHARVA